MVREWPKRVVLVLVVDWGEKRGAGEGRGEGRGVYLPGCWKYIGGRLVRQTLWFRFG